MKEVTWWKERTGEGIRNAMWDAVQARLVHVRVIKETREV